MDGDIANKINNDINELESKISKTNIIDGKIISSNSHGMTVYDLTDDGTGKKYDSGKPMVGTLCQVFPRALMGIGACIEFGTHKYPKPDNWKLVEGAFKRYQDSLMRHYLKFQIGEIEDRETKLNHLFHMAWNALAITELYLMDNPELVERLLK